MGAQRQEIHLQPALGGGVRSVSSGAYSSLWCLHTPSMNRQSTLAARRRRMNSRGGSGPVAGEGSPPQPQAQGQGQGPGHGQGQGGQEELLRRVLVV